MGLYTQPTARARRQNRLDFPTQARHLSLLVQNDHQARTVNDAVALAHTPLMKHHPDVV